MDDEKLLRYSRQIMLPEVDLEGQEKLASSSVILFGLGGLGSPIAMYLAAAGVGRLVLVDHDIVELSNLQRQIIHQSNNINDKKVLSAKESLLRLNPHVEIKPIANMFSESDFADVLPAIDVLVDGTDNFKSRFEINKQSVKFSKPLVSGAATRFEGQVGVFDGGKHDKPCYRCLYPKEGNDENNCAQNGVIAPLLGIIGSIQALETLKVLMGIGDNLCGRILLIDALAMEWQSMRLNKDENCPECGPN